MTMEIFRALGTLAEPPTPGSQAIADVLELGQVPDPARHTDLFAFQLYPFASVYLGPEGQLGGVARDRIAGFWRALGLTPPAEPDHLAVLLGAYADLTAVAVPIAPTDPTSPSVPGNRGMHARAALLWEHLLSWLPLYLKRLQALDDGFYARWAGLLAAALDAEAAQCSPPPLLPLHLREAPFLEDPRAGEASTDGGGRTFLGALLAPVRTGMILTRDDLRRAARDLNLGSRIGERRFVLEALLGQAPAETLTWLADEAQRQACHSECQAPDLTTLATFWSERATTTAALLRTLASDDASNSGRADSR